MDREQLGKRVREVSDERAQAAWYDALRYLVLARKASPWAMEAWEREKRAKERALSREHTRRRRKKMTVEARRQEWRKHARAYRDRLAKKALEKREEMMR